MMRVALVPLVLLVALATGACAQTIAPPNAAEARLSLFKSLGGRQCESAGQSAEAVAAPLRAAGIQVLALHCGHDGRMRAQVCGGSDGRIAIVEVPASKVEAAKAEGFAPLTLRPDAMRTACR